MTAWDALQNRLGGISRGATEYTTNLYVTREQVARWCAAAPLQIVATSGAVLALRGDRDFQRVYHTAESWPALTEALAELPPGTYVSDLVGQGGPLEQVCAAYAAAGFTPHSFLQRMSRGPGSGDAQKGEGAEPARVEDVPAVAALLERLLDPYTEKLPEEAELVEAAVDDRLLIVGGEQGVQGMLMFDLRGHMAHLRFCHVDRDARGAGLGRQLMSGFLRRCARAKRIVLWVIGDNDRSIAIYRHYGFAEDGLLDRIMLLHKDRC